MPLIVIIVWLSIASIMIISGIVLTVRRSAVVQRDRLWVDDVVQNMTVEECSYCGNLTVGSIGVTHDGRTYDPICLACQYRTGIRRSDEMISEEFMYQVKRNA